MRVWYGEEQEGAHKGEATLYVEMGSYDEAKYAELYKFCTETKLAYEAIYLGAGRSDPIFKGMDQFLAELFAALSKRITVTVEVAHTKLNSVPGWLEITASTINLVVRFDTPIRLPKYCSIKIDTGDDVYVFAKTRAEHTSLAYLSESGLFEGDLLVYSDVDNEAKE